MSNYLHLIEFRTREGFVLQRVDHISTILESSIPQKNGGDPITVFHLLLANNVKVEIIGETRESLEERIRSCGGLVVIIVKLPAEVEPSAPVAAEPVGNAVIAPAPATEAA